LPVADLWGIESPVLHHLPLSDLVVKVVDPCAEDANEDLAYPTPQ
jgi:hypothetical protein